MGGALHVDCRTLGKQSTSRSRALDDAVKPGLRVFTPRSGYAQAGQKQGITLTRLKKHGYNGHIMNKEMLEANLTEAMRAKDEVKKRTLRMVLSAVKLAEIDRKDNLDEPAILGILQRELKSRQETVEEAKIAGRDELLESTRAEIEILQAYLPQPLEEAELAELVQRVIREVDASSPQDMGTVMKALMPQIQGRADGKAASDLVREFLSST